MYPMVWLKVLEMKDKHASSSGSFACCWFGVFGFVVWRDEGSGLLKK